MNEVNEWLKIALSNLRRGQTYYILKDENIRLEPRTQAIVNINEALERIKVLLEKAGIRVLLQKKQHRLY